MGVTFSQLDLISQLMDATALRHRVLGQNIANVNTPGYKRQEVSFEQELIQRLSADGGSEIGAVRPQVFATEGLNQRSDGNNVDIDIEMGQLTKNALLYETYAQLLGTKLSMMRSAINGRA